MHPRENVVSLGNFDVNFAYKLVMYHQRQDRTFQEFVDLALQAERVGFKGIYVVDHLILPADREGKYGRDVSLDGDPDKPYFIDAWTSIAAIAAVTRRVRIGTQITPIALHHPVQLAKMATTVDLISNGRLDIGIGTGHRNPNEYMPFGLPYEDKISIRTARMVEGIEVMKKLWTEDKPVSYSGKYFNLKDALFWPKPVQKPHPPIWMGGTGPRAQEAAARFADGWSPAFPMGGMRPEVYAESLANVRSMAKRFGRDPEKIEGGALLFTCVSEDRDTAISFASRYARARGMPLEDLEEVGGLFAGTPDDCIQQLERYVKAGCTYPTMSFVPHSPLEYPLEGLELYGRKVLPYFRGVK